MSSAFDPESGFMNGLSRMVDTLILAILWLICCIPVFTVGASSAALYYAYHKSVRQDTGKVTKTFFRGFVSNFKQATGIWLVMLVCMSLSFVTCYLLLLTGGKFPLASAGLAMGGSLVIFGVIWCLYLFPYGARFENKASDVLKNSAILAVANLPWSVLLLVIFVAAAALAVYKPALTVPAVSVYIWLGNGILERIFRKLMTEEALQSEIEFDS